MADKTIVALTALALPNLPGVFAFDTGTQTFKVTMESVKRRCLGDAVVGTADGCTHATLALALADADVLDGMTIALTENANLAAKVTISKKVTITGPEGRNVTLTKTGGTIGLEANVEGITIKNLRFAGYTVSGDKAIKFLVTGTYGRVKDCNFVVGTDTDIDDASAPAGKKPLTIGNIVEV